MPIPISDRLFIDYLRCKYKAYLKFSGKSGVKSDFEMYQDDKHAEYRQRARELRAERNTEPFILTGTFKDVKKQNLFIAIMDIVTAHRPVLDNIANALLEREVLEGEEVYRMVSNFTGLPVEKLKGPGRPSPALETP